MTAFSNEVIESLVAPLSREHVKEREQGRSKVSYIEGWHAIAEANRIFGFDGWMRETVMSECCHAGEYEKAIWENGRKTNRTTTSFRCSYRARVRVTVMGIVREGSGHGHGFADNPGEAHESAEKEAETDAMKRALMTFGNPFGLPLYDKKQAEVEPASRPAPRTAPARQDNKQAAPERPADDDPFAPEPPKQVQQPVDHPRHDDAVKEFTRIRNALRAATNKSVVDQIVKLNGKALALIREVHEPSYHDLMTLADHRTDEFRSAA